MSEKMKSPNTDNITQIQESIQAKVRDIEKEKINLRISQERYSKKLREYNEIIGKPIALTKEQKLKMIKDKLETLKKRQIFSPTYGRKVRPINPEEEIKLIKKSTSLSEIKLNDIKNGVNKQALINERILQEINEVRKDKLLLKTKLTKIEEENEEIERNLKIMTRKNQNNTRKINYQDLKKSKDEGLTMEAKFKLDRDYLEDKYHKVIEANIRKERIRTNELSKQRMMNAIFADNARKRNNKSSKQEINEDEDEIQDRMPILDSLLNKWNYIIKYKKQMINKYINYGNQIRNTFDKLILLLGLERYDELPQIYEKDEIQMAKIDELLSKTTNDVEELKSKKILLQKQINILTETKKINKENNQQYIKEREINKKNLKQLNDNLLEKIEKKRQLFRDMQECTFNFLKKMQNTYLVDFVVKRVNLQENSKITEQNVIDYLGAVYCFIQLINDFYENVENKKIMKYNLTKSTSENKNIESLQKEMMLKLSNKFNYKECLNKVKIDIKQKSMFDEIIFRLANDIVNEVNDNNEKNDNTDLNTNASNSENKKKVISNNRYKDSENI